MDVIDRGAIVVKPKQPFVDWLHNLPEPMTDVTIEQAREECAVYLVPAWESEDELSRSLSECCEEIFENELWAWYEDESTFPSDRTLAVFREWFEIEACAMVMDVLAEPADDDDDEIEDDVVE